MLINYDDDDDDDDDDDGPLVETVTCIHHSFIEMAVEQHFMALQNNADISILNKSVILGLPFCVFTGIRVSQKRKINVYRME